MLGITEYIKPTKHKQVCKTCSRSLLKGDHVARIIAGWGKNRFPIYSYYHLKGCFKNA